MNFLFTILFYTFVGQHCLNNVSHNLISNSPRRVVESTISFLQQCGRCCSDRGINHTTKHFTMQHRKDGLYQPNPFSLVNSDYQQNLTKEIKDFFGDISFEEVQEELFEISRMLVTKETLKNYSVLSVRERGYTLQRVLMLLTRLHFINSKPESNGTN